MVSRIPARRFTLVMVLLVSSSSGLTDEGVVDVLDYEVTAVKGKLLRESPKPEEKLRIGAVEHSGALLRTGWRSAAGLHEKSRGAEFELDSRTRVRLAGDRPGVLIELEKGRLRAIFEKISAGEAGDRAVMTPSAVLTVRGTDYVVDVDGSGNTTVVVFEGEVEVVDVDRRGLPVRVAAGKSCLVPRGQPPGRVIPHSISPRDWNRGRMPTGTPSGTGPPGTVGGFPGGTQQKTGTGGHRRGGGG